MVASLLSFCLLALERRRPKKEALDFEGRNCCFCDSAEGVGLRELVLFCEDKRDLEVLLCVSLRRCCCCCCSRGRDSTLRGVRVA